jgi:predicted secreted hydrolase
MSKSLIFFSLVLIFAFALSGCDSPDPESDGADESRGGPSRLSELLGGQATEGFTPAINPRAFSFPADHGPHTGYRNEWWYFTGNLGDESDRRFGYELTIFRFSLEPPPLAPLRSESDESNWRTGDVYIAHFAVSDAQNEAFHVEQRYARAALGLAGARGKPFHVWIEDWSVQRVTDPGAATPEPEQWRLNARADGFSLDLALRAEKPPVLNGLAGLSQKSAHEGNASYYYSIPRLRSEGTLRIGNESHAVSGLSWMDREWSSSALAADQQGWDWFALQLSDGSDLMFYQIRKSDGSPDPHSAGTWIPNQGEAIHLSQADVKLSVNEHWLSPAGGSYPAAWTITVPRLELQLEMAPLIANQELITSVRYWEGAVTVEGRAGDRPVQGRGYVELTGYAW